MSKLEQSNSAGTFVHEGLNIVGDVSEKPIKYILAATVLIAAIDTLRDKSALNTLRQGLTMTAALKGISIIADIGVDLISHPEKSS